MKKKIFIYKGHATPLRNKARLYFLYSLSVVVVVVSYSRIYIYLQGATQPTRVDGVPAQHDYNLLVLVSPLCYSLVSIFSVSGLPSVRRLHLRAGWLYKE